MVASSSRHMHQQNLRGGSTGKEDGDNVQDKPRSALGGGGGSKHRQNQQRPPPAPASLRTSNQSTAVLEALLSDEDSQLAKFLFCDGVDNKNGSNNGGGADDTEAKSMGTINAGWYTLALEPLEVRNERIIMIFEAYALFGALFMNAVWIIYEWGNANDDVGEQHEALNRTFNFVMAIALCSNVFLSLHGAGCWMMSIMIDSANQHFVFESRTMLTILQNLLMFTSQLTSAGLVIGMYKNLSPNLPEVVVAVSIGILMYGLGNKYFGRHFATCMPLEIYHFPPWVQIMMGPSAFMPSRRKKLRAAAKLRARELRKRAFHERSRMDPNSFREEGNDRAGLDTSLIGGLLRTAANNLGRNDEDMSVYEERLEKDWFNEVDQLKGRSVECLSRYMPLRLGEEVHKLVGMQEREGDTH